MTGPERSLEGRTLGPSSLESVVLLWHLMWNIQKLDPASPFAPGPVAQTFRRCCGCTRSRRACPCCCNRLPVCRLHISAFCYMSLQHAGPSNPVHFWGTKLLLQASCVWPHLCKSLSISPHLSSKVSSVLHADASVCTVSS